MTKQRIATQILIRRCCEDADVFVSKNDVSRDRARIHREAGRYFVAELGSRNGTRLG